MLAFHQLPPELRLMLALASPAPDAAALPGLAAEVEEWDTFLALTLHHQLAPAVHHALASLPGSAGWLPAEVAASLRRFSVGNAVEVFRASSELGQCLALLAEAGVPAAVLKGLPLAVTLYGDPAARHIGDLDLLIAEGDARSALMAFAAAGYELLHPAAPLTPRRFRSYVRYWKDFTFRNPDSGFEIDVHWRLFSNRWLAANGLERAGAFATVPVHGMAVRTLAPAEHFLYVSAHGAHDSWTYLKSLVDAGRFLDVLPAEERNRAAALAAEHGCLGEASAAAHLAQHWLGVRAPLPGALPAEDRRVRRFLDRAARLLVRSSYKPLRLETTRLSWLAFELSLSRRPAFCADLLGRVLFRPRLWSVVNLPDRLFPLYPLVNLVTLPRLRGSLDAPRPARARHRGRRQATATGRENLPG